MMKYIILLLIINISFVKSNIHNIIKNNYKYECMIMDRKIIANNSINTEYLLLNNDNITKWIVSNKNYNYNDNYKLSAYPFDIGRKVFCKYNNDKIELYPYKFCNHNINHRDIIFSSLIMYNYKCDYYEIDPQFRSNNNNIYTFVLDIFFFTCVILSIMIIKLIINKI